MEEQVKQEENSNDKTSQKYEANWKKLVALFKSDKPLKGSKKLPKDDVSSVIDELLKERKEKQIAEFKIKASELIDKNIKFNKEVAEAKKQMEKTIQDKKAEYNKAMEEVFNMIDGIAELEKDYYTALTKAE